MGLASVFAGLCALMAVLGFVENLVFLVIAIPFGAVSYVLWYQASGRLRMRARRQARRGGFSARARTQARGGDRRETGGFGAGPREEWTPPGADGPNRDRRAGPGGAGAGRRFGPGASGRRTAPASPRLSVAEAYDVLDLDPGADTDRIRQAYRERVKDVHPDADGGSESDFKRVQRAYERLQNS
jgi:hypothetical protein